MLFCSHGPLRALPRNLRLFMCFLFVCRLFFVIEFVSGGDLMYHMQRQRRLPEDHARY